MATVQAGERIASRNKIKMYDHDPNTTAATAVAWVDMRDYGAFGVMAMASALTGAGVTAFSIQASAAPEGTNPVTIRSHAVGSAPDAVGDQLFLEVSAEEVNAVGKLAGKDLRYVSAVLTMANSADENVVTYFLSDPRFASSGLTADVVS